MKKLLALLLALVMVLSFAACSNDEPVEENSGDSTETSSTEETPVEPEETAATYTLGMGVVASDAKSKDGQAQVDATVAAVVFDEEGKIVKCELDVAQTKVAFEGGVLPEDLTTVDVRSKQEKKEDYGMLGASAIGAEWYTQADAFATAIVGMTAEEVAGLELVESNGHQVLVDETLHASCSMDVTGFQAAIAKAAADEYAKEFTAEGEFTLGLALDTSVTSSKAPAEDKPGTAAMNTNFTVAVFDANGAILANLLDVLQAKVPFDATGVVSVGENDLRTKKEKKGDYGMLSASAIGVEWMDQATAFENAIVGMTAADVAALELVESNGHQVLADETLHASCSMDVTGFQAGLTKAAANAR